MNKKNNNIKKTVENKIEIIKNFARQMGYETDVYEYNYAGYRRREVKENEKCIAIDLIGTADSEGNPYSWAWSLQTGREIL